LPAAERPALRKWSSFILAGDEVEHYEDLATMTNSASAVVRASVESVAPGRIFGDPGEEVQYVLATLRVHEVIAGEPPPTGNSLKLELGPIEPSDDIQKLYGPMIGDSGVFFVRRKGEGYQRIPADPEERALGFYHVVNSQGGFLNDRGRVFLAFWAHEGFPNALSGMRFDEFVSRVRSARS
jgi:hypothetical protein